MGVGVSGGSGGVADEVHRAVLTAMGFTYHLMGDPERAIQHYHQVTSSRTAAQRSRRMHRCTLRSHCALLRLRVVSGSGECSSRYADVGPAHASPAGGTERPLRIDKVGRTDKASRARDDKEMKAMH